MFITYICTYVIYISCKLYIVLYVIYMYIVKLTDLKFGYPIPWMRKRDQNYLKWLLKPLLFHKHQIFSISFWFNQSCKCVLRSIIFYAWKNVHWTHSLFPRKHQRFDATKYFCTLGRLNQYGALVFRKNVATQ